MRIRINKKRKSLTFTLLRVLLAFILFFVILSGRENISIYLFGLTAFLSFFEAFIYRKQKSQLMSIVSLLADKFLVNLTAIALVLLDLLPISVMFVFLGRDILTVIGGAY